MYRMEDWLSKRKESRLVFAKKERIEDWSFEWPGSVSKKANN